MHKLDRTLRLLIARATHKELADHLRFVQAQLEMARSRILGRIMLTTKEKNRLVRFGSSWVRRATV